jgi:hypothetical protein
VKNIGAYVLAFFALSIHGLRPNFDKLQNWAGGTEGTDEARYVNTRRK